MEKKKSKVTYLIPVCFLFTLLGIGILNIGSVLPVTDTDFLQNGGSQMEEDYRTNFWQQRRWVDLYGIVQNVMGKRLSGNMRFIPTAAGWIM